MSRSSEGDTARTEVEEHAELRGPPLGQQAAVAALVVTLVLALLAACGVVGVVRDTPFRLFTKEVVEQTGVPTLSGFLAHITWFLWVVAGTAGLLAAAMLRRLDPGDRRIRFFLSTSALTAVLLFDDFVMFHERLMPKTGIPQQALYALYAVVLVALLLRFRTQFARGGALLAVAAGAFWAASVVFDLSQERWGFPNAAVEDGSKMIGTALWAAFMVWSSLTSMRVEPQNPCQPVPAGHGRDTQR